MENVDFTPREHWSDQNENCGTRRVPKVDKMLLPMPGRCATAALLGQVDWIEAPAPDMIAEIKQRGFVLRNNEEHMSGYGSSRASRLAVERHSRS
jgi:hypothetical protein